MICYIGTRRDQKRWVVPASHRYRWLVSGGRIIRVCDPQEHKLFNDLVKPPKILARQAMLDLFWVSQRTRKED